MYREDDADSLRALVDTLRRERDEALDKLAASDAEVRSLREDLASDREIADAVRAEHAKRRREREARAGRGDNERHERSAREVGHSGARPRTPGEIIAVVVGIVFCVLVVIAFVVGADPSH